MSERAVAGGANRGTWGGNGRSSDQTHSILLVEDDSSLARGVKRYLTLESRYQVEVAATGEQAIEHASQRSYDVALLDWQLDPKGMDGLDVCRCLCRNCAEMGIIFITAYDDVRDKILALEAGADDYLAKPFDMPELAARIRAVLRRKLRQPAEGSTPETTADQSSSHPPRPLQLVQGALCVDLTSGQVHVDGQWLDLPKRQYLLLVHFLERPAQIVSEKEIRGQILQTKDSCAGSSVRNLVYELRRALGKHGEMIHAVRGKGYLLTLRTENRV